MARPVDRALLVHGGALGDFVLSLRIVSALRAAGPARVIVLGRPSVAAVGTLDGQVDEVFDLDTGGFHTLFHPDAAVSEAVRQRLRPFRRIVNMLPDGSGIVSRRLAEVAGAEVQPLDPRPREDWPGHVSDQWLADLGAAGLNAEAGPPRIEVPLGRSAAAARALELEANQRRIVLHPGGGSARKCWPVERYLSVAEALSIQGHSVLWLLGPVEAERWAARVIAGLRAMGPMIVAPTAVEAAALLASAHGFVGNDSGPAHLAAAVGIPTVAVFGATHPQRWRPLGENAAAIGGPGDWPEARQVVEALDRLTRVSHIRDQAGGVTPAPA